MNGIYVIFFVLTILHLMFLAPTFIHAFNDPRASPQDEINKIDVNSAGKYNYLDVNHQPIVNLPHHGQLRGTLSKTAWTNRTIYQFLGVNFAETPSGIRRFKAPVPVQPWHGIRSAEKFGKKCPGAEDLSELSESELNGEDWEDCLNLAIYSPDLNASLPVMFYVHGGGCYQGSAQDYHPDYLLERDFILVVIQYRLDAFGFLSTDSTEVPGNAGVLDTLLALKFVKENIANFGVDSNQITIIGHSSGGAIVSAILFSPNVPDNLFHRAVMMSGAIFNPWTYTEDPIGDARDIAEFAGLNRNDSIESLNAAFMNMNVLDLLKAVDKYQKVNTVKHAIYSRGARTISIGGPTNILPELPERLFQFGKYNKSIPVMLGFTREDGQLPSVILHKILKANGQLYNEQFLRENLLDIIARLYYIDRHAYLFQMSAYLAYWNEEQLLTGDYKTLAYGLIDILGTIGYKSHSFTIAQANAKKNRQTYLYTFDYAGEFSRFDQSDETIPYNGGVLHGDELIYLFAQENLNEADTEVAKKTVDFWTSFATTCISQTVVEEKNSSKIFTWPPFSRVLGPYLHINQNLSVGNDFTREFSIETSEPSRVRKIN